MTRAQRQYLALDALRRGQLTTPGVASALLLTPRRARMVVAELRAAGLVETTVEGTRRWHALTAAGWQEVERAA